MARSTASKALRREFAKDYYKSEEPNAEARFEEFKKQFPEIAASHKVSDFYNPTYQHLVNDDTVDLCAFLVNADGNGTPLWETEILISRGENSKGESKKPRTVTQRVESMVHQYRSIRGVMESEQDESYKSLHEDIVRAYKSYFSVAVDDLLLEAYGDAYKDFAAKWREDKRKEREEKKAAKEAAE